MTDQATETTETPAAPDAAELDAMALSAMGMEPAPQEPQDEPEDDGADETPPEPEETAEAASQADDEAKADDGEEDPNKPTEERKDESKQKRLDRLFKAARLKEKEAERKAADAERRAAEIEAKAARVQEVNQVLERFGADPVSGVLELAGKLGIDSSKLVKELAERQLEGGEAGSLTADAQRKQWEEWKRQQEEREQQRQQLALQQEADAKFRNLCTIQSNDDLAKRWPHTASMHPADFQRQVAEAIVASQQAAVRVSRQPNRATDEDRRMARFYQNEALMLDELEKLAELRHNHQQERLSALRASASSNGEAPSGASGPDPRKASRGKSRTLSNDDTAHSSGATKPMSEAARQRKAEELALQLLG